MDLILWRHADAHDPQPGQSDLDRALTPKGEKQAERMARWLDQHLPESTRVLVSPALRAQQTAAHLPRKSKRVEALAPDATVDALLHVTRWPESREPVLVVGHQPTLGLAAAYLLSGHAQPWTVRKGAIWWLRWRQRQDEGQVLLQTVLSADRV